ncbi:MAG: hypothetical protein QM498_06670 [Desulfobacterium sp.]
MKIILNIFTCVTILVGGMAMNAFADDAAELAKKAQDPLANISAVQLDMSAKYNIGPDNDSAYTALVQPVYAISTEKINYIPRLVIPIIGAPNTEAGNSDTTWGMGDIVGQMFISPKSESAWKWGVGPQVSFKTHTDDALAGSGWGGGVAGVLVGGVSNFSVSFIANHLWGNEGDFSTSTLNPMIFYNFKSMPGVSLSYQGVISYDWKAEDSSDRLTIPLGLQIGKMFDLGGGWGLEPAIGAYGMPVRAKGAADWEIKASIFFIIP